MVRNEIETAAFETVADIARSGMDPRTSRAAFAVEIADEIVGRNGDPVVREFVRIVAVAEFDRAREYGETGIDPDRSDTRSYGYADDPYRIG